MCNVQLDIVFQCYHKTTNEKGTYVKKSYLLPCHTSRSSVTWLLLKDELTLKAGFYFSIYSSGSSVIRKEKILKTVFVNAKDCKEFGVEL